MLAAYPTLSPHAHISSSYAYVDYSHISGLQRWMQVLLHISAYDINCQYRINFATRMKAFREKFTGHLSSITQTYFPPTILGIGKFHLPAHIPSCRFKYSFNWLPGVGMTDGEALERIWSFLNALAARAKEMTSGHRHDFLNDVFNDMNIRRLCGLREYHCTGWQVYV